MRIGILKVTRGFQYEVVNIFAEELGAGLQELGHEVLLIEVNQSKPIFWEQILSEIEKGLDLVLHFNGFMVDDLNGTDKIYIYLKKCNIPVGVILVDHPFLNSDRLTQFDKKNTFITMYDEGFLHSYERYIDDRYIIAHLMHGGSYAATEEDDKKIYDVIMAGTINKPLDFLTEIQDMEEGIFKDILINVYEKARQHYYTPLDEFFNAEFEARDIPYEEIRSNKLLKEYIRMMYLNIDKSLRQQIRFNTLKALLEGGVEVQLYGNCHVEELKQYDNLHIHGPVHYRELLSIIKKSKILIHDVCPFTNGSHERFLSSMLNKTLVIANKNNYCNGQIKDGQNIVYFDSNNYEDFLNKVKYYLVHDDERERITENAYCVVKEHHTWKKRAEEIIDIYKVFISIREQ